MEHFSYSLLLSLIHSLWQAALLLCFYFAADLLVKRTNPVYKRNLLFVLLLTQVIASITTFFIYYSGETFLLSELISSDVVGLFSTQGYMEIFAPWLILSYGFIVTFKAIQLFINWHQFRNRSKTAWVKPSIDLKLFTIVKANQFGIKRKVSLWYSNAISTPLTFGFLKPVILLPVALVNNLSIHETETLIIHELTHIRNNDYLFNWMLIACETLFFFNPFIKIITNRIKLEREKNCDSSVLQFNYQAVDYAETLLKAARFKATVTPFFLAAVFKNAQLVKRIKFFTKEKNLDFYKRNYSRLAILPVIALFVFNVLFVYYIKHRNVLQATVPTVSNAIGSSYNENVIDHFSTEGIPVVAASMPVTEEKNIALLREKVDLEKEQVAKMQQHSDELLKKITQENINIAMPVVLEQQQPENTKEITLKEENSATGTSVTKVYQLKFENGKWKTTLLWTITERRIAADSLPFYRDTTTTFFDPSRSQ